MKKTNRPPVTPGDPPKSPQDPPKATQNRPQSSPVLRFSDPRDPCRSVLSPCLWIFAGYIDTVSILYRYSIDIVSIQYRYRIDIVSISYRYSIDIACKNPKTGCLWGRKTERQVLLGSENRRSGELWGRSWVASGGSWGDFGGSERGRGRPPAADMFFFHFRRFKIMKLCQNLNLLWKRLEID